jgi:hypothetical protein
MFTKRQIKRELPWFSKFDGMKALKILKILN